MPARDWHIITSEYPPAIGGVSDLTFAVAGALSAHAPVHVWCPRGTSDHPPLRGVQTHAVSHFGPSALIRLSRHLNEYSAPRRLFVQWTPQGFGWRSLNVVFAAWLAWRGRCRGDAIDLMVHEPYVSWSAQPTRVVAAVVHRLMLALACLSATRVWVSTTAWLPYVRPYLWSSAALQWLPVPAPNLACGEAPASHREEDAEEVVGHFSMYSPLITPLLTATVATIIDLSRASVLLIGQGSDAFRTAILKIRPTAADRVRATGAAPPLEIARALRSCDLMVQPYPDGVTTRRTSTLTAMALGLPVVTNTGRLTEPLWHEVAGVTLVHDSDGSVLGLHAVELLANADRREQLGAASRSSYEQHFAVHHAVRRLNASAVR